MPAPAPPPLTPAELLAEAVARANALGWRTISVRRLRSLGAGDASRLPSLPKTSRQAAP